MGRLGAVEEVKAALGREVALSGTVLEGVAQVPLRERRGDPGPFAVAAVLLQRFGQRDLAGRQVASVVGVEDVIADEVVHPALLDRQGPETAYCVRVCSVGGS